MSHCVDFSGLWIPLVTPFRDDRIDAASLERLVKHLSSFSIAGFVVCGSTGEAESLSHTEQLSVLDTVFAARGEKAVLMGMAGTRLPEMLPHLKEINQRPVAGLLISAPYYLRPAQAGIINHFRALADASSTPIVLYDVPARTGVQMALSTLHTLAEHPNILAIKDCGGDEEKTRALIEDRRLAVLAGDDARIFSTVCLGGIGAIAAAGHLLPQYYAELVTSARAGKLERARRLNHALTPLSHALFAEPNPSICKGVLAHDGWMQPTLRAPHCEPTQEGVARAVRLLQTAEQLLAS